MNEDAVERGRRAAVLLSDPLFREVLATLESKYSAAWRSSSPSDVTAREESFRMLRSIDELKGEIQSIIENGVIFEVRSKKKS